MSRYATRTKRKGRPIDDWQDAMSGVETMPPISKKSVQSDIRREHDRPEESIIHVKVSLKYPSSGPRIEVPARSVNCKHLQCFDLATYLRERDRKELVGDSLTDKCSVYWNCPICSEPAELHQLRVDGYFKSILKAYADLRIVEEVEILSDGNHRPVVQPKVEVVPLSESPFLRGGSSLSDRPEEKPEVAHLRVGCACYGIRKTAA
ncbi:Pias4 protein [Aphelenchoides avenae]|nr:Pias4 protein [Aphelenchus avenae]